jgi:hypothetical protein
LVVFYIATSDFGGFTYDGILEECQKRYAGIIRRLPEDAEFMIVPLHDGVTRIEVCEI